MNERLERPALWLAAKVLESFDASAYQVWVENSEALQLARWQRLASAPTGQRFFASLIVCDDGDSDRLMTTLAACFDSGRGLAQIIVAAPPDRVHPIMALLGDIGPRAADEIVVVEPDCSPADAENMALGKATGEYIAFLSPGDILADAALSTAASLASAEPSLQIIYSDEDWLDDQGNRVAPRFKSDWDPDAQLGRDLFGRLCLMRREAIVAAGGLRPDFAPAEHYDLHCRIAFAAGGAAIKHIPLVLYHRREPDADGKACAADALGLYAQAARRVAAAQAQAACGLPVPVTPAPLAPFVNRVHWPLSKALPLVSILIPTRDRVDLLRDCVEGVLRGTDYPAMEVLILDNGSEEKSTICYFSEVGRDPRVRILPLAGPFNYSKINNRGVAEANGEILVFMNNDIKVIGPNWLREMVSHALRPDIGCVGAKLLYGDRRLQHAGVVLKPGPLAMHVFRLSAENEQGYDAQLAGVRSYSAVTAACLAVRREVFEEVGGFNERDLKVGYNDIDLGLKVDEHGYRNVCTPFEPLFHLEGASRGAKPTPEKQAQDLYELSWLVARWRDRFQQDPYAHPSIELNWEGAERVRLSRS